MSTDRLNVFKAPDSDNGFIVVVMHSELTPDEPLHVSNELARDEAKYLLRHYNLADSDIEVRLAKATIRVTAMAAG
jgi:hypothetical protein